METELPSDRNFLPVNAERIIIVNYFQKRVEDN